MSEIRPLIVLRGVTKTYRKGRETIRALNGVDLEVAEQGMVAVVGPSGSGKSSLLHVIGAMDGRAPGRSWWPARRSTRCGSTS